MQTANDILAHIKGQIEAIGGELEHYQHMSDQHKSNLLNEQRTLKDLERWIQKPVARDHDAFDSSAAPDGKKSRTDSSGLSRISKKKWRRNHERD